MFQDVFGWPLQVGDIVTYPVQHGHCLDVRVAEVVRFNERSIVVRALVEEPLLVARGVLRPGLRETVLKRVDNITRTTYSREAACFLLAAVLDEAVHGR